MRALLDAIRLIVQFYNTSEDIGKTSGLHPLHDFGYIYHTVLIQARC